MHDNINGVPYNMVNITFKQRNTVQVKNIVHFGLENECQQLMVEHNSRVSAFL